MLLAEAKQMLNDMIIPFWKNLHDSKNGGYFGWMDFDLNVNQQAVKGCILNSRILWFFSAAALALKRDDLKREAEHAYAFLKKAYLDREYGGVYWSVNYDGTVCDDTKHTYNQAFAIYALSAYYRLTLDREALAIAYDIYHIIENRCTDDIGYLEAQDRSFHPIPNDKLSENGVLAEKTMNTLLHVFEGYSGLYEVTRDEEVGRSMRRILDIFCKKVYNPEKKRQEVFFDRYMNPILDLHSYGHDIETSWLMDWGCGLLGDESLSKKIAEINNQLADNIYHTAYHNHSVWNECDRGVENKMRVWWVQAESVLGFLNAYQKNPQRTEYLRAAVDIWNYIKTTVKDPRPGSEWFWQVDDNGNPDRQKPLVEPWKCPYHNGRLCLEILRRQIDDEC
jgi:mannobiose 2-epimerase